MSNHTADAGGNFLLLRRRFIEQIDHAMREKHQVDGALSAAQWQCFDATDRLSRLREHCLEESINIMVVGESERGKTTVVNTLLQEHRLPVGKNPCTAAVVEVRHGDSAYSEVYFKNIIRPKVIPTEDLSEYCATPLQADEKTKSNKDIERIVTYCTSALLINNVTLIDSPGLNDVDSRIQRTLIALNKADIFLVVLSALATSRTEERFLSDELPRWLGSGRWENVIILWNKWDELEAKKHEDSKFYGNRLGEIRAFENNLLLKHVKKDQLIKTAAQSELVRILEIEAGQTADTGWPQVLAKLELLLDRVRDVRRLSHPLRVLENIVTTWMHSVFVQQAIVQSGDSQDATAAHEEQQRQLEEIKSQLPALIQKTYAEIKTELRHQYPKFLRKIEDAIRIKGKDTDWEWSDLIDFGNMDMRARSRQQIEKYFREQQELWWTGKEYVENPGSGMKKFIDTKLEELKMAIGKQSREYANKLHELQIKIASLKIGTEPMVENLSMGNASRSPNLNLGMMDKLIENALRTGADRAFASKESKAGSSVRFFFDFGANTIQLRPMMQAAQAKKPDADGKLSEQGAAGDKQLPPATSANKASGQAVAADKTAKPAAPADPAHPKAAPADPAHPKAAPADPAHPKAAPADPAHPSAAPAAPTQPGPAHSDAVSAPDSANAAHPDGGTSNSPADAHPADSGHFWDSMEHLGLGAAVMGVGIFLHQMISTGHARAMTTEELILVLRDSERQLIDRHCQELEAAAKLLENQLEVDLFSSFNDVRQVLENARKKHQYDAEQRKSIADALKNFTERMNGLLIKITDLQEQISIMAGAGTTSG